jgi:hypothetical protein
MRELGQRSYSFHTAYRRRDSSVGLATGWMAGVRIPSNTRLFSSPQRLDHLWGPPSLISMRYRRLSPEVKRPELETDHLPQYNDEIKNGGALPPLAHTSTWLNVNELSAATTLRFTVRDSDVVKFIGFLNWPNPSSRTMALGSTQPPIEMSTRNLPGGKIPRACNTDNLTAICVSRLSRKCLCVCVCVGRGWGEDTVAYLLRHCATSRKVAGSRPDKVNAFFQFT